MAKMHDFTQTFKDMMGAYPVDTKAMEEAFKTQSQFAEKMSAVVLDAAQKSTTLSADWAKDTFAKMSSLTAAKSEPTDYMKSMTDFATAWTESSAEKMAAYAEIAKKVQTETLELMLAAGKDMSEDMQEAAQKASESFQNGVAEAQTNFQQATY